MFSLSVLNSRYHIIKLFKYTLMNIYYLCFTEEEFKFIS